MGPTCAHVRTRAHTHNYNIYVYIVDYVSSFLYFLGFLPSSQLKRSELRRRRRVGFFAATPISARIDDAVIGRRIRVSPTPTLHSHRLAKPSPRVIVLSSHVHMVGDRLCSSKTSLDLPTNQPTNPSRKKNVSSKDDNAARGQPGNNTSNGGRVQLPLAKNIVPPCSHRVVATCASCVMKRCCRFSLSVCVVRVGASVKNTNKRPILDSISA